MIDPELRERILRTLRWVVPELEHRFNDCKQNLQPGSQGGYSDELKEIIALKQDLEQGELVPMQPETTALVAPRFTLKECMDAGILVSLTLEESTEYFHHYNSQGWLKGNGLPIINLQSAMFLWMKNGQKELSNQTDVKTEYQKLVADGELEIGKG